MKMNGTNCIDTNIIVVFRFPHWKHKGARWMPRLMHAMKDATNLRKVSGRRYVAIDPKISEWGNPICIDHLFRM
jgi:hypothetical protein